MNRVQLILPRMHAKLLDLARDERGDVPGWVLITIMTAGLVTVLWQFAGTELVNLFRTAVEGVSG